MIDLEKIKFVSDIEYIDDKLCARVEYYCVEYDAEITTERLPLLGDGIMEGVEMHSVVGLCLDGVEHEFFNEDKIHWL